MISRFRKPAVEVEALQFQGLTNLQEVFEWLQGIIYIPEGHDSEYRRANEYDEDMNILRDAPPFGIIMTRSGYDRVDVGNWIVKYDPDRISVYEAMDFSFQFEEVVH